MSKRDVELAVGHCETVADALTSLPELGRVDSRRRQTVERVLGRLTNPVLEDLERRGRFLAVPDGYKARASGSGDGVRGGSELTSVESAVARLTGDAEHVDGRTVYEGCRNNDEVGKAVQNIFSGIEKMARLANALESADKPRDVLRPLAGVAGSVERGLDFVVFVHDKARGRVSTLAGPCQCCGRQVAGTEKDRMRSGLCEADYKAWCRDGRPERAPWIEQRRQKVGEKEHSAA